MHMIKLNDRMREYMVKFHRENIVLNVDEITS
jgi:hypothetical protein